MTDQKPEAEATPRRPTDEEILEELRQSRGDTTGRPSEQEPLPPHYSGSRSSKRTEQYGKE